MNLGSNTVSSTYQYILNQDGANITLGNGNEVNWDGAKVMMTTGNQTIAGIKNFTSDVGVGVSNPLSKLAVNGEISSSLTSLANIRMVASSWSAMFRNDGSDFYLLSTVQNDLYGAWNNNRPFMYNFANGRVGINGLYALLNGNVGIGETSPVAKLHLKGSNNSWTDGILLEQGGTAQKYGISAREANRFCISDETNSQERFSIIGNGNIGIGTITPTSKLEVNGTIKATTFAITNDTKFLASNTALPTTNTDVDILTSASLAAGTYLVNAHFLHNRAATTAETVTFKIYDGANINASQAIYRDNISARTINGSLTAIVALASPGTIKLQAATSVGNAASLVLAGTKSTQMTIIKIG